MQQLIPTPPEPNPHHRYPDCIWMKVEGNPVSPQGLLDKVSYLLKQSNKLELKLTIRFGEQEIKLPTLGSIKFGIKRGELRLFTIGGKIPSDSVDERLADSFEIEVELEQQEETGKEKSIGAEFSVGAGGIGGKIPNSTKETEKKTKKTKYHSWQVTPKGSEENAAFVFKSKTDDQILSGQLTNIQLGTLNVIFKPCSVKATFEVLTQDIEPSGSQGLLFQEIIPEKNRRKVLDIAIAKWLLPDLAPYLSQTVLCYE